MVRIRTKITLGIVLLGYWHTSLVGFFPINFWKPWDINVRPPEWCGSPFQLTAYYEGGIKSTGFNSDNNQVNVLQIWSSSQDALAMLKGFPANSPESLFFTNVLMNPQDDGVRGHLEFTGNLDLLANAVFAARYHFAHEIIAGIFVPVLSMRLKNVRFRDLTQDITAEDVVVKDNLTDNFLAVVQQFDPALELGDWKHTGLGDLVFMGEWLRYFPQAKECLKNVGLNVRLGVTVPTGVRTDINELFSVPFGFDGSWGIFFGGGIILNWFEYIRAGVDFEFLTLLGMNSLRRIKTQVDQTDFLLLAKARAHTEYGFTQRYNLFAQAYNFYHGLSASVIYQFWKHNDDKLALFTNDFSNSIANTAVQLQEWTIHQVIFKLDYDPQCDSDDACWFKPQLQLLYKLPFNGKRSVGIQTITAGITLNF